MTQYNRVNVKLSTSQLNKLKSATKNKNDVVIRLSYISSAADAGIHKKILILRSYTTLIISNKDTDDLIKIVKSLEESYDRISSK